MFRPRPKRNVNRLERMLKASQQLHKPISEETLNFLKFGFSHIQGVKQITISSDSCHELPISFSFSKTSPFLLSQLEAQGIANPTRIVAQIAAALTLILETSSKQPLREKLGIFPTLFRYFNPESGRLYIVYAYLAFEMESRRYTIDELLQLRDASSRRALSKLRDNREVADIVKGQESNMPPQLRRTKRIKEDVSSSTESDEILFQGKKSRATQWQYRGRTDSEVASNEPLSAPTGLVAQKDEGFQRFFKAVVSPTHVRVTAGGRIVPNTRGSVSPTAKWDKERPTTNGLESKEASKDEKSNINNATNGHLAHPLIPVPLPGHPGYFHHMGLPMPLYPIPHGIPMAFGVPPHLAHLGGKQTMPTRSQQDPDEAPKDVKSQDGAGDKKPRPAPIKIAPRDQLDQNRPFYYNGNVIYPSPYGFVPGQVQVPMMLPSPYFPHGMVGNPGSSSAQTTSFGPMAQPSPSALMFGPAGIPSPHLGGLPSAGSDARSVQPQPAPSQGTTPHITSIRPSEITKRQLDSLRASLKYYEDQLQYNRHQIDEKWTTDQAEKLKHNVQQFEQTYKAQANFEASYYPQATPTSANSVQQGPTWKTSTAHSSIRSRRGVDASQNSSIGTGDRGRNLSRFQSSERLGSRPGGNRNSKAIGINSSKGLTSPLAVDHALEVLIQEKMKGLMASDRAKNTGITPGAATGPAYDGAQAPFSSLSEGPQTGYSGAIGLGGWQGLGVLPFDQDGNWNSIYSNTTPANGIAAVNFEQSPTSFGQNNYGQPYLVGTLPQGVNAYNARTTDYVYSRELTEEEKRARSNYWGHVSTVGLGLPKFDGKDFYPPSPAKAARGAEPSPQLNHRSMIPSGRPDIDFNFRARPAETDPFHSNRESQGMRLQESGPRPSKAIPIVAPNDASRKNAPKKENPQQASDSIEGLRNRLESVKISSPAEASDCYSAEKKQDVAGRRTVERSSNKSGNELWQTMLKRGPTSGAVLPSTVSSTTATGYLPQYQGHAAASLGPAISNTNSSTAHASPEVGDKTVEYDAPRSTEKVGENCPPNETRSADYDPLKDVQERMLRDAERRGVVGSEW